MGKELQAPTIHAITPADNFIQQAISSNAPVETLEKLMALKERYDAAEAKKSFIKAMQKFQSIKPELKRSASVSFGAGKTAYNFCPLSEIEKQLAGPLSECGLSYRFENFNGESTFGVRCIVTHEGGHSESTAMSAPADQSGNKNSIQAIGSTSTYLMRYTVIAAFALTTADDDDDGQNNSELPYKRVIDQSHTLHDLDTFRAVLAIKEGLAADDYEGTAEIVHHMGQEKIGTLWIAPTKGGIFTTAEIAKMKSSEFSNARIAIIQSEQEQKANG